MYMYTEVSIEYTRFIGVQLCVRIIKAFRGRIIIRTGEVVRIIIRTGELVFHNSKEGLLVT